MPDDNPRGRFNPFLNEADMFKVLILVLVFLVVLTGLVFAARAIF